MGVQVGGPIILLNPFIANKLISLCCLSIHSSLIQKFGIIKTIRSVSKSPLNSTELKLLLVFSYFTLIEILFVLRASLTYEDFQDALEEYFTCEESGVDPSNPCVRNFGRVVAICAFTAQYSCILLIPAVCSVFVMDVGAVGASIKKIFLYIVSSLKSQ